MKVLSRRSFFKVTSQMFLAASGLIGLAALFRFLEYPSEPPAAKEFDLGPASNYPVGSSIILVHIPGLLVHSEAGFSVFSLVCTHLGCRLEPTGDGFFCPCHGSEYRSDGVVQKGPADTPMANLTVEQNAEGHLVVKLS